MARPINGKRILTHRVGDIYFGVFLQPLPNIPSVYRRFIPEDYESQIPVEERQIRFLAVGHPDNEPIREETKLGKITKFLLENSGRRFTKQQLYKSLDTDYFEGTNYLESEFKKSKCFDFHFDKSHREGKNRTYELRRATPDQGYIDDLRKLDKELGINQDSLDSAML